MTGWARYVRWSAHVMVVALVAACLWSIFQDPDSDTSAGSVRDGFVTSVPPFDQKYVGMERGSWTRELPYGRVSVDYTVGGAIRVGDSEHVADGTSRWVRVNWRVSADRSPDDAWPGAEVRARHEPSSRLVLVAGGRRYVLAERLLTTSAPTYRVLSVNSDRDMHLVLEAGGRQFRTGYGEGGHGDDRLSRTVSAACRDGGSAASGRLKASVECGFSAQREPYVAGLGWAPKGKDWVVVRLTSAPPHQPQDDDSVGRWRGSSGSTVSYVRTGGSSLTFAVTGGLKPVKIAAAADMPSGAASDEDRPRAYLVPSDQSVEATMTYRTDAVPHESEEDLPALAPERATVKATASLTLDGRAELKESAD